MLVGFKEAVGCSKDEEISGCSVGMTDRPTMYATLAQQSPTLLSKIPTFI